MKACSINRQKIKQMLKILTIYAAGLLVGAISGFLPLISLLAGFPILIARQNIGLVAARIMTVACLAVTWLFVDPLSFIFIGLGVAIGYSLLFWRNQCSLGGAYNLSIIGGAIWLMISNWSVRLMEKKSLLSVINETVERSLIYLQENMAALEVYSPEQLEFMTELQKQAGALFSGNWPVIVFVFICLATTFCLLLLARFEPAVALQLANWREARAPVWLALATLAAYAMRRFAPDTIPWFASNLLSIGNFVLLLAGYTLIYYYIRHLRFSWGMGLLFTIYLLISPWLRPILSLIGQFDALFDYRQFVKAKTEPQQ